MSRKTLGTPLPAGVEWMVGSGNRLVRTGGAPGATLPQDHLASHSTSLYLLQ